MSAISRRDFLKLAAVLAPSLLLSEFFKNRNIRAAASNPNQPNIILLVLDAMNAKNLSVYGYPRRTTPNLERFAERATVYHRHYSGANFTIPGTASLLTGTYPWTHRALNYGGAVTDGLIENNLFRAIDQRYHRSAFSQNVWANFILAQFADNIDEFLSPSAFGEVDYILADAFKNDPNMAYRALDDFVFKMKGQPNSMVFGALQKTLYHLYRERNRNTPGKYPQGLPHDVNYPVFFQLDTLFEGLASYVQGLPAPFFTYLHVFCPHAPYRPTYDFSKRFSLEDRLPLEKPVHRFSGRHDYDRIHTSCLGYDRYLASIDKELGKFLHTLETNGVMDNSYVIITSDHGEIFERGETGHVTRLLYEPLMHIPLLISIPGQRTQKNVHSVTSSVDLLPTLAHLTGGQMPGQCEGQVLPGLGGSIDVNRTIFSVEAKKNPAFLSLNQASIAMVKGRYKLIYYTGYEEKDSFEFYDLATDLEEMRNIYRGQPIEVRQMRDELLAKLDIVNKPFDR